MSNIGNYGGYQNEDFDCRVWGTCPTGSTQTALDTVATGKKLMGDSAGLGATLNTQQFSDWYANPDNAKLFNQLSESEQANISSNFGSGMSNADAILAASGNAQGSGLFGIGTSNQWGAGLGVAQFGLGLASYLDNRKFQKKQMEGMDEQLAQAKDDAYATQQYRAAYGATNRRTL